MLFNSFEFLIFLPIVVFGYYCISKTYRWLWLLLASYLFYSIHEPRLLILLIISTLTDYFCGLKMANGSKAKNKKYLILSLAVNLGMLFIFKYLGFFTTTVNNFFAFFGVELTTQENGGAYNFEQILLPVGISFYTFQTLSYTIDIYRGNLKPEKHLGVFALYVSFFPQLVAGPIERASRLIPQLKQKLVINITNIKKGIILIAWGLFLKVVVADRLGIYVDAAFANPNSPHGFSMILGALFFCFQIYYDFSAYTSIAIGAAKTINIELMQNFNKPIFATSIADFWKRWHISLMEWLRDYLFIPLGGSRGSKIRTIFNLLVLFIIVGLWHGASWTFVIWGILNALILVIEYSTRKIRMRIFDFLKMTKRGRELFGWPFGFTCIFLTLVFFRSPNFDHAMLYIKSMFQFRSLHINLLNNYFELILSISLVLLVQTIHYFKGNDKIYDLVIGKPLAIRWSYYIAYIFIIVLFAINRQNTFIYFQF